MRKNPDNPVSLDENAIRLLEIIQPSVNGIITDVMMQGGDYEELIRQITELLDVFCEAYSDLAFILKDPGKEAIISILLLRVLYKNTFTFLLSK